MIKNCPICGKAFDVQWPHLWRYKRDKFYLCSWKCIRLFDEKGKEAKPVKETSEKKRVRMNPDDMAEAVRLFKIGDSGLDQYLTEHGVTNIGKWKSNARVRFGKPGITAATLKVDGPLRIETPEAKKVEVVETPELKMGPIPKPIENIDVPPLKPGLRGLNNSDFTVSAIKHPQLGEFYYDQKFNSIDWRSPEGEEISLHPAMWKELYMIIPDVMGILGVPDYE